MPSEKDKYGSHYSEDLRRIKDGVERLRKYIEEKEKRDGLREDGAGAEGRQGVSAPTD